MGEILITGHEEELAAIAAKREEESVKHGRYSAMSFLGAAMALLEREGPPSPVEQYFGRDDTPEWRIEEAIRQISKALDALRIGY